MCNKIMLITNETKYYNLYIKKIGDHTSLFYSIFERSNEVL